MDANQKKKKVNGKLKADSNKGNEKRVRRHKLKVLNA